MKDKKVKHLSLFQLREVLRKFLEKLFVFSAVHFFFVPASFSLFNRYFMFEHPNHVIGDPFLCMVERVLDVK